MATLSVTFPCVLLTGRNSCGILCYDNDSCHLDKKDCQAREETDAALKAAAEEELERIRSLLKVLISGLNKVLMNASLIAFPVNDSSPEIP